MGQPWSRTCAALLLILGANWALNLRGDVFCDFDEGVYASVAAAWARGARLYAEIWDHKGPVVYLIYRAAGALSPGNAVAVRLFNAAFICAVAFALYASARQWWGDGPGLAAAVAFPVVARLLQGPNFNTETMAAPFVAWAFYCTTRGSSLRSAALAGFLLGLAVCTTLKSLVYVPVFAWVALLQTAPAHAPQRGRRIGIARPLAFVLAVLVVPSAFAIWLAAQGALPAAWDAIVAYNSQYARVVSLASRLNDWKKLALRLGLGSLPGIPGLAYCLVTAFRRPQPNSEAQWNETLLAWLLAGLVAAFSSGRPYPHYLIDVWSPTAMFWGLTVYLAASQRHAVRRFVHPTVVAIFLGVAIYAAWQTALQQVRLGSQPRQAQDVCALVTEHSAETDRLFIWGNMPQVYARTGRQPAARFVFCIPLISGYAKANPNHPIAQARIEWARLTLQDDLARTPPQVLLVDTDLPAPEPVLSQVRNMRQVVEGGPWAVYVRNGKATEH